MDGPIPNQISGFGFCLVRAREKRPFELAWQKTPYKIDDPKFQLHLQNGGNYGVICSGGVVVLDVDAIDEFSAKVDYADIPDTFTVKTGGGGHHFYFLAPGVEEKIVLKNGSGNHLGELQAGGGSSSKKEVYIQEYDSTIERLEQPVGSNLRVVSWREIYKIIR